MQKLGGLLVLSVLALTTTGCTTILKQTYNEIRGAQGKLYHITQTERCPEIGLYDSVRFAPPENYCGTMICPPTMLESYESVAQTRLHEYRDVFQGGTPQLTVQSTFLFGEQKDLLGIGEGLVRVRIFGEGQTLLVDALCRVVTQSFRKADYEDLGEAAAETVVDYLAEQKDPDYKEKRKERMKADEQAVQAADAPDE